MRVTGLGPFLCGVCYSTTLDRDLKALEQRLNRRMLVDSKRGEGALELDLPFERISAFARPLCPVVSSRSPPRISVQRWGLLPRYIRTDEEAQEFLKRTPTYNAVSEEVEAKRTYKHAFAQGQRCLVPVTGFFEWRHEGKVKVPYRIGIKGGDVFCLGGLWEEHDGVDTYTVLTTRANPLMAYIHNSKQRMPVIVPEGQWDAWLSPDLPPAEVKRMCEPVPEDDLEAERLGPGPVQTSLF